MLDRPACQNIIRMLRWDRLREAPARKIFNSHLWQSIPRETGHIESKWTMFSTSAVAR